MARSSCRHSLGRTHAGGHRSEPRSVADRIAAPGTPHLFALSSLGARRQSVGLHDLGLRSGGSAVFFGLRKTAGSPRRKSKRKRRLLCSGGARNDRVKNEHLLNLERTVSPELRLWSDRKNAHC